MEIWGKKAHHKSFNPYVRNCTEISKEEENNILKYTSETKCRGFKEDEEHLGVGQREESEGTCHIDSYFTASFSFSFSYFTEHNHPDSSILQRAVD